MRSILEKLSVHSVNAGACTGKGAWVRDPEGNIVGLWKAAQK